MERESLLAGEEAGTSSWPSDWLRKLVDENSSSRRLVLLLVVSTIGLLFMGMAGIENAPNSLRHSVVGSGENTATGLKVPRAAANIANPTGQGSTSVGFADLRPVAPFVYAGAMSDRDRATECLAMAAWYEAGDDLAGQKAVIQVVLNRLRHPAFPASVCGVVFQGSQQPTSCQFTFTCDGSRSERWPGGEAWQHAMSWADEALDGATDPVVGSATHYHADYVHPWWSDQLQPVSRVGDHVFYVWPGETGRLRRSVFVAGTEPPIPAITGEKVEQPVGEEMRDVQAARAAIAAQQLREPVSIDRSARSSVVRRAMFMNVDPTVANGRWAVDAMNRCIGKNSCVVIGYSDIADTESNARRPDADLDRPEFLFVRDSTSGMDVALWDCERAARTDQSQCLPENGPSLARLMRDR